MHNISKHVIEKCGGHEVVAGWLGVSVTSTYRWTYPKVDGGTGGIIPARYQQELLDKAKEGGIALTPTDFFPPEPKPAPAPEPGEAAA